MFKNKLTISDLFCNSYSLLEEKSDIEYFSKSDNMKLNDPDVDENTKENIKHYRKQYFISLGLDINTDMDSYDELIKNSYIKRFIPSEKIVEKIIKVKSKILEKAKKDYYFTNYDMQSYSFGNKTAYNNIENELICINSVPNFYTNQLNQTLFFTLRSGEEGMLDCLILHELYHVISSSIHDKKFLCGFEKIDPKYGIESNPYNKLYRKYERLEENITDIFAILSLKIIRNKDIYILDEKGKTVYTSEVERYNTFPLTKRLLMSFVLKYRHHIVKSRILGDTNILFMKIGKENFEALNDAINKLDYLLGLKGFTHIVDISQIDFENTDDSDILKISNCVKRVEQIYINMNNYQNNINNNTHIRAKESKLDTLLDYTDIEIE